MPAQVFTILLNPILKFQNMFTLKRKLLKDAMNSSITILKFLYLVVLNKYFSFSFVLI